MLEEIVGEIEDESDRVESDTEQRPDGTLVCRASADTRKVLELLELSLDVEPASVGGLVAQLLGRLPRTGDILQWEGFEIEVLRATARRAERVAFRKAPRSDRTTSKPERPNRSEFPQSSSR